MIPVRLLHGLVTSLHIILNHPTAHQLTNVFNRCYYSLNVNDCISSVVQSCAQCQALISIPKELIQQTSSAAPTSPLLMSLEDVNSSYLHSETRFHLLQLHILLLLLFIQSEKTLQI